MFIQIKHIEGVCIVKINSITEHNAQNNKLNFKAKLQISGNTNLLTSIEADTLKEFGSRIGSKVDVIDIALPITKKTSKSIANANIAGWVNGTLKQFTQSIEKTDVLGSLIEGLKSNYFVQEVNHGAWKGFIDLEDKKTFNVLDTFRCFVNKERRTKIGSKFHSVEDMLDRINEPIVDWSQKRIIHFAVQDPNTLKLCLKHPNIDVNAQDYLGRTSLYLASSDHLIESLKLLFERPDIDMTIKANSGLTAEHCIYYGDGLKFWEEFAANGYKKFW